MNATHLSEISEKQDGEPVMAIAGEVKYASDIGRGKSPKGNDWSRQFFVLAENGAEVGCTLWDADDGSVKKGEHVRFENTQNKKGQWSGITKTSYTKTNKQTGKQELVHALEIRANQVQWIAAGITNGTNLSGGSNAGEPSNTERGVKKSEMGTDQRTNPPPAQNSLDGITEARQHLCQAANLYNLCVKAVDTMVAPELPLTAQNSDMFQAAVGTLFIEASRNGFVAKMPVKPVRNGNDKAERIRGNQEPSEHQYPEGEVPF